uniref:Globin n=1 Tax=Polypedilum nubifer TaxID=54969 RepID=V5YLS0_9DIPT|nr:globin [Polypedilum nubifer]
MGNVVTNIHSIIAFSKHDDIVTPEAKNLDERQVALIKKSWEIVFARPLDSGEKILYAYLEKFPHNQEKFAAFRNTPLIMLKGTPGFRSHASKIMGLFGAAVDALGQQNGTETILNLFNEMGKNHRRRGIPKRAFIEIRAIIVQTVSELCKLDDEGKAAWNDLLDTVYHIIFSNLDVKVGAQGAVGGRA